MRWVNPRSPPIALLTYKYLRSIEPPPVIANLTSRKRIATRSRKMNLATRWVRLH